MIWTTQCLKEYAMFLFKLKHQVLIQTSIHTLTNANINHRIMLFVCMYVICWVFFFFYLILI